eukprot:c494_g1_i1.p2 GENE.c494_g1_i1~~c494_g1_i1.p2  ORF type:complete len:106 (-),score=26.52 c494_g1_i1:96-413(-)
MPQAGEEYADNARREVEEEMGVRDVPLTYITTFLHDDVVRVWTGLFTCGPYDGPLTLQEEEVESVTLMKPEELLELAESGKDKVTSDGLHALRLYLAWKEEQSRK